MGDDLRETWGDIAHHWDDWGPPLRPCEEDLRITCEALRRWHAGRATAPVRVFMCGVTPEIATMAWPFQIDLVGMDQAASMVQSVWPGDVAGLRRAVVGNWLEPGLPAGSRDVVIGDGGFGFFGYPSGQQALALAMRTLLEDDGLFVYRHYAQAPRRESLEEVRTAARAGAIGSFHVFKWRLAMALQEHSRAGVRLHDIWQASADTLLDTARLPQPGWSARAMSTIRFYRDKDARLYFPTLAEFRDLLAVHFGDIEVHVPAYELGDRCPILIGRPRTKGR